MAGLAACLFAGGCEHAAPRIYETVPDTASEGVRALRESEMNARWQNHSLSELLNTLGPPRLVLAIPGGGNPPSYAVVYGVDAKTGCIDAFAVHIDEQPFVRIYYCR